MPDASGTEQAPIIESMSFQDEQFLFVHRRGDLRKYFVSLNKEKFKLYECSNDENPAIAAQKLEDMRHEKLTELENKFHIQIARDGQLAVRPGSVKVAPGTTMRAYTPRLGELIALEQALLHSSPSHLRTRHDSDKGITIYFLKDTGTVGAAASWGMDPANHPCIFLEPGIVSSPKSLWRVLVHELAHNAAYRLGMDLDHLTDWRFASKLGWQTYCNVRTGQSGWLLRTKNDQTFKFASNWGLWIHCNRLGDPLDADGKRVKLQKDSQMLSTSKIREIAEVPPCTEYFPNPMEHFAEGLMMFRLGATQREQLMELSPQLYAIIKEADQKELDKTLGDGQYMRNLAGMVIATDKSQLAEIASAEQRVASSPRTPSLTAKAVTFGSGCHTTIAGENNFH